MLNRNLLVHFPNISPFDKHKPLNYLHAKFWIDSCQVLNDIKGSILKAKSIHTVFFQTHNYDNF